MKGTFKFYAAVWLIVTAVLNIVVFSVPVEREGSFWVAYGGVMLALVIQLASTAYGFSRARRTPGGEFLYAPLIMGMPLSRESIVATALIVIVGMVCLLVPDAPVWVVIVVDVVLLAAAALPLVAIVSAAQVAEHDVRTTAASQRFVRGITAEADALLHAVADPQARAVALRVYEDLRYSDPVSAACLEGVEARIRTEFDAFRETLTSGDVETARTCADRLHAAVSERNALCKSQK